MKPNQIIALGKPHVYYLGGPYLICKASSIFNLGCEGEGLWKRCKTCVFVQNFGFVSQPTAYICCLYLLLIFARFKLKPPV